MKFLKVRHLELDTHKIAEFIEAVLVPISRIISITKGYANTSILGIEGEKNCYFVAGTPEQIVAAIARQGNIVDPLDKEHAVYANRGTNS